MTRGAGVAALRYAALVAARDRGVLAPLLALLLLLLGVYAYRPNDVQGTWALTALLSAPVVTWLRIAVARAEPDAQRLMRVAAAGGHGAARARDAVVDAALVLLVVAVLLAYPLLIGAFDRPVTGGDLLAAASAHAACALAGAALGRLAAPPVTGRAATALVLVLGATLASVAVAGPLGALAGPAGVADALAAAPPGTLTAGLLGAEAVCLAVAALLEAAARRAERRAG
jgi:hypothetical protein